MMKRGDKVTILRGIHKGETGEVVSIFNPGFGGGARIFVRCERGHGLNLAPSSVKPIEK